MDYFNEPIGSRCAALAPLRKLSTVKSKDQCYTAEELKLVIRWAHRGVTASSQRTCVRRPGFDGYLVRTPLIWADGHGSKPGKPVRNEEIIGFWNEKFLRRPFHCMREPPPPSGLSRPEAVEWQNHLWQLARTGSTWNGLRAD